MEELRRDVSSWLTKVYANGVLQTIEPSVNMHGWACISKSPLYGWLAYWRIINGINYRKKS